VCPCVIRVSGPKAPLPSGTNSVTEPSAGLQAPKTLRESRPFPAKETIASPAPGFREVAIKLLKLGTLWPDLLHPLPAFWQSYPAFPPGSLRPAGPDSSADCRASADPAIPRIDRRPEPASPGERAAFCVGRPPERDRRLREHARSAFAHPVPTSASALGAAPRSGASRSSSTGDPHQGEQGIPPGIGQGGAHPMRRGGLADRAYRPVRWHPFPGGMGQHVVNRISPASSIAVVCTVAISCLPSALWTISSPLESEA
jgi:hypothetical protein